VTIGILFVTAIEIVSETTGHNIERLGNAPPVAARNATTNGTFTVRRPVICKAVRRAD
jgi:hypothetical protein